MLNSHVADNLSEGQGIIYCSLNRLIKLGNDARRLPLKSVVISNPLAGNYLSPFKGRGMEFDEVRPYQNGDDVRAMDWRVTAKTGKPHTKLFREERERSVFVCVDFQKSMFFATRGVFKSVKAAEISSLLAWSTYYHGDKLGGITFSESEHVEIKPQGGHKATTRLLNQLSKHSQKIATSPAEIKTQNDLSENSQSRNSLPRKNLPRNNLLETFIRLRRVSRPGSLIFVISDFRHWDESINPHLMKLSKNNDLVFISITDPIEKDLPTAGTYRISDGLKDKTLDTANKTYRKKYRTNFLKRMENLDRYCKQYHIHRIHCSTQDDPVSVLQHGLGLKQRR